MPETAASREDNAGNDGTKFWVGGGGAGCDDSAPLVMSGVLMAGSSSRSSPASSTLDSRMSGGGGGATSPSSRNSGSCSSKSPLDAIDEGEIAMQPCCPGTNTFIATDIPTEF